jgi:hypothetical protein
MGKVAEHCKHSGYFRTGVTAENLIKVPKIVNDDKISFWRWLAG